MKIKHFAAASFAVLPLLTMLGNGCTVHVPAFVLDDGGDFASEAGSVKDSGHKDSSTANKDSSAITDGPATTDGPTTADGPSGSCAPGSVSGFSPTWKPPTAFHQGACTPSQVSAFVDCLSDFPDAATCNTFMADAANTSCKGCALTADTASSYGPLVEGAVAINVNIAGCVARASGDLTATGCGAKMSAATQCEALACETNCPVPANDDGSAFNALLTCESSSDGSVCKTYADAALCGDALVDGGAASICASGATFSDNAKAMVSLFCGT